MPKESVQEPTSESRLKVREIRHDAPLPRQSESRPYRQEERRTYQDDKRTHQDERRSREDDRRAPSERRHGERRDERHGDNRQPTVQTPQSVIPTPAPQFDDKPAMSLKDALAKAMQEKEQPRVESQESRENSDSIPPTQQKREVSEEVLRKLIQEE